MASQGGLLSMSMTRLRFEGKLLGRFDISLNAVESTSGVF